MRLSLLALLSVGAASANRYADMWMPEGKWVKNMSGVFNVPKKPSLFYNGKVTFLWPGLMGNGGRTLLQPVLTLGEGGHRTQEQPWVMANWADNCDDPGYCHDTYLSIQEGDELSWWMGWIKDYANKTQLYRMAYTTKNGLASSFDVWVKPVNGAFSRLNYMWATEAELWYNATQDNRNRLPQSPFYVWGLKVTDEAGQDMPLKWSCNGADWFVQLDCSWSDPSTGRSGVAMYFNASNAASSSDAKRSTAPPS